MVHIDKNGIFTKLLLLLFLAGIGVISLWVMQPRDYQSAPFHIDEVHKISETFFYHLFFEERNFSHPAWKDDFYARTNPPIGKYVLGFGLALQGIHVRDQELQHLFHSLWESPKELKKKVNPRLILAARKTSIFFSICSSMLLFLIGYRMNGFITGLGCSLIWLLHPMIREYTGMALMDSVLLFFMILAAFLATYLFALLQRSEGNFHKIFFLSILSGIACGSALGTRYNGGFILLFFVILGGILIYLKKKSLQRHILHDILSISSMVLLTILIAGSLFFILNPYYWDQPIGSLAGSMADIRDMVRAQQRVPEFRLDSIFEKAIFVGRLELLNPETWGRPWANISDFIVMGAQFLALFLFIVGFLLLLLREFRWVKASSTISIRGIVLVWVLVTVIGTMLWIPLAWARYTLPPLPAIFVVIAYAVTEVTYALLVSLSKMQRNDRAGRRAACSFSWLRYPSNLSRV